MLNSGRISFAGASIAGSGALVAFILLTLATATGATATSPGKLTGGIAYQLPDWFKESFLELAEDAAEAAEADRHVMLFMDFEECPYCEAVLRESIVESSYSKWLRKRFDIIAINVRGDREVAFDEQLTVPEKQLAEILGVRQTPSVIFLDATNKPVQRSDGYRTAADFKRILDYVDSKAYLQMDLTSYIVSQANPQPYTLRPHPAFSDISDLSASARPVLVLFEDSSCTACDLLHDTLLAHTDVNELMKQLTVVRLDASSEQSLITPEGVRSTPREWARTLGLNARPGFVLFDDGKEQLRIEGVLRHFHFATALRYGAERQYDEFESYREFSRIYRQSLLDAGIDVDLGSQ